MKYSMHCLLLIVTSLLVGCHWRGETPSNPKPVQPQTDKENSEPLSRYPENFLVYEKSIIETLKNHKVTFTVEENPRLQVGIAKFLLAKVITSDSGSSILIGAITDWEGVIPKSGKEFSKNGAPAGIQVNNFSSKGENERAILCVFTYGQADEVTKDAIITTMRSIEGSPH